MNDICTSFNIFVFFKSNQMKEDVFNQYVDRVISLFNISKEELFSKTKERTPVDARQMVYYLCYKRQIRPSYIVRFMSKNDYSVEHSTIIHGIKSMEKKVKEDKDYSVIIKDIDRAVFI